ncbi:MAG: alpha/beta hydrolase [Ignavibacteriae bacterium]|nr:alpha/beta hydrolase [Ignavibacteriota bacterium]
MWTILSAALFVLSVSACDILEPGLPGDLVPKTVDEDSSLPSIAVNGTLLHAESFGNPRDPMIVVLHGGPGGDYRAMLNCTTFVDDGFYVVLYDQRGCGLSRRHDKSLYAKSGPTLFIDDLAGVISHYRSPGQKVILLGKSWGAMLATAYVNEHPGDISGVIMMEPGGFTWDDTKEYIRRWRSFDPLDESANDAAFVDQVITSSDHARLDYKAAIQGAAEYAPGNALGIAGPYPFWRMGAACAMGADEYVRTHSFDFTTQLAAYTRPVLFVYSEYNRVYGKTHAERVSSAYPNVQLAEIHGSGHDISTSGWESFYPIAKSYLSTIR